MHVILMKRPSATEVEAMPISLQVKVQASFRIRIYVFPNRAISIPMVVIYTCTARSFVISPTYSTVAVVTLFRALI
jgi:hypothetical protein